MNTPRAKMSSYMNSLKISVGHFSLKSQYLAAKAWGDQPKILMLLIRKMMMRCAQVILWVKKNKKYHKAKYVQRRVCFVNENVIFLFVRAWAMLRI